MITSVQKSIETQITEARARATICSCRVLLIRCAAPDVLAILTSAQDASRVYTIRRDQTSGILKCSCPATVVCKHIGLLLVRHGVPYHTHTSPAQALPLTLNPHHPETIADEADALGEEPCSFTPAEAARMVAFRRVAAWLASLEAATTDETEASVALMLAERSERTLAGQMFSQEERLRALACLPVAIAAYAVVLGPTHGWQWHQAKEEQWDRYQACRMSQCWY